MVELSDHDVVVVGAGFSGLYMVHRARDVLGLDVLGLDAAAGPGGTWYWNRYPGARCDSESYYYCYAFSEALLAEWDWTARYPEQPEILRYLEFVADRLDLRRSFRFDTAVIGAVWDEDAGRWIVRTSRDTVHTAQFLVSAVGCLSSASVPEIPGRQDFAGEQYHSGRWPQGGVEFSGKRVALIGTGSTGIQAAPVIARQADHLSVFQRTANFSVPARDRPMDRDEWVRIKSSYDEVRHLAKTSFGGFPYEPSGVSALEVTDRDRRETYERLWAEGGFRFLWGGFSDILFDETANQTAADFIRDKIRATVRDPEIAERLCPNDHPYGSKRPPIDTDYYETFNRDNVTLVDIREHPITRITHDGIETTERAYGIDVIVHATGFDAITGTLLRLGLEGRDGLTLAEKWRDGPQTYLGLQTRGFPNLFMITGPGSPSVLTNMPTAIEQHVEWIGDCIAELRARGAHTIEPVLEAERAWSEHVAEVAGLGLFQRADSWYLGANIPGKRRVFLPYAGGLASYRERCDVIAADGYAGFLIDGAPTPARAG